jgi:hypothetical protein
MGNVMVFGIFNTREDLEGAILALKDAGFRNADISALFADRDGSRAFAADVGTKAPELGATGAGAGAILGGVLGWLVGIGALTIPGLGPFIAAGPIMAALAGAGMGGTIGGLTGALMGLGIPEHEARRYEGIIKQGGILLSVHSENLEYTQRAKILMESHRAKNISSTADLLRPAPTRDDSKALY